MAAAFQFRDIFREKKFNVVFSFIIGLFIASLMKPVCRGTECYKYKTPPVKEITTSTYKIGDKCYQFKTKDTPCPATGAIEPYEDMTASA
jgi:hypothetical protein